MKEKTFTTGQILGITFLHRMTLYRYVRDFPDFFSPTAQQHKKGRRWTVNDLEVVQAIKYLRHEHTSNTGIRETLSTGWRPEVKRLYDLENVTHYFEELFAYSQETREIFKEIKKQLAAVKSHNESASRFRDNLIYLNKRVGELNQEILRIKYYLRSPTKPKRNEFYRTWQQFREEVQKAWNEEKENTKE